MSTGIPLEVEQKQSAGKYGKNSSINLLKKAGTIAGKTVGSLPYIGLAPLVFSRLDRYFTSDLRHDHTYMSSEAAGRLSALEEHLTGENKIRLKSVMDRLDAFSNLDKCFEIGMHNQTLREDEGYKRLASRNTSMTLLQYQYAIYVPPFESGEDTSAVAKQYLGNLELVTEKILQPANESKIVKTQARASRFNSGRPVSAQDFTRALKPIAALLGSKSKSQGEAQKIEETQDDQAILSQMTEVGCNSSLLGSYAASRRTSIGSLPEDTAGIMAMHEAKPWTPFANLPVAIGQQGSPDKISTTLPSVPSTLLNQPANEETSEVAQMPGAAARKRYRKEAKEALNDDSEKVGMAAP